MTRPLTDRTVALAEMQDPKGVLDRAGGRPVAVMEGERVLGYFVPVEAVQDVETRVATREEAMEVLGRRLEKDQPVLDWLKDR